jgi:hypothetical protein
MKSQPAFALQHSRGGIILPSVRHSEGQVRAYAIDTEREYETDEYGGCIKTDKQLWKRCYGQGFRVVSVVVSSRECK